MGCCLSTEENRATQKQSPKPHQQLPCISKSPPRSEEESVKEVLSETPKPRPNPKPDPEPEPIPGIEINKHEDPKTEELEQPTKPNLIISSKKPLPVIGLKYPDPSGHVRACNPKPRPIPIPGIEISKHEDPKTEDLEESTKPVTWPKCPDPSGHSRAGTTPEISHVSEMCSQSESISNTTLREREEDEDEVLRRVCRSQGKNSHFTTRNSRVAFSGGSSPVRRFDPSPTRRRNMVSGPPMENPGRRSRSPATRSNVSRSPSGRRTGPSPGRVRNGPGQERESGVMKVDEDINVGRREKEDEKEWEGPNESLENPLVSLECFIFL